MAEEETTEKLYYSISEVSQLLSVNSSTLRFWEKEFSALKPNKTKKGNRIYTKNDIEYLEQIVDLIKTKGYTIQGAKEQLKKTTKNNKKIVIEHLTEIKNKLIHLRNQL
ncbi:MAG: MerR family transcriptional regulator [Bacteroidetes bacterium]|nr:MerR family transcriptional regulator [Bacteroidota bacterium]